MKTSLTRIFWPILKHFEKGAGTAGYKPSHRTILIVVGCLFLFLSLVSGVASLYATQLAALLPVLIFFAVGLVSLVVGTLGSNDAVARIWGNR